MRQRPATGVLGYAALILFWAYILTVVLAGLWGVVGARLDFPILLHQPVRQFSRPRRPMSSASTGSCAASRPASA